MSRGNTYVIAFSLLVATILVILGFFFLPERQNLNIEQPPADNSIMPSETSGASFLEISSQKDCANECSDFKSDEEKYRYCRSYCGLSAAEGQAPVPSGNCEEKNDIERDQCLKDEAVEKKDMNRCFDIFDENLKKSCQARVTEEYLP